MKQVHGQLFPVKVYPFGELSNPHEEARWYRKIHGEDVSGEKPTLLGRLKNQIKRFHH